MMREAESSPAESAFGGAHVRIRLTDELVQAFAGLTGDVSSLHVDDAFARRSSYRQPVVHGMLPLAFLPLLAPLRVEGRRCTIRSLTGRFASPAFRGETLVLALRSTGESPATDAATFEYRVTKQGSTDAVTTGTVTVAFQPEAALGQGTSSSLASGLLTEPAPLESHRFEDVAVGQQERPLAFEVRRSTLESFHSLLAQGVAADGDVPFDAASGFGLPDLLALLLYSTSVGVSLPGASATFIDFTSQVASPLETGVAYRLEGVVTHRSKATGIIKKVLRIVRADGVGGAMIEGKVSTLVNDPSRRMATMGELAETALDLGLKAKVVLVTGASRGIGETTAKLFALLGAKVVVNFHRGADDADRVVREIRAGGGEAMALQADVSDATSVRALVRGAVDAYGVVDVLVNNAAKDFRPIPFSKLTWEDVQGDLDVIVKGAFLCCQEVIPVMLEAGGGAIVNVSSVATEAPPPDQLKYVVAKSALNGLTRSLAADYASRNVRVNMVVPAFVETDLVAHVRKGFRQRIADEVPMGRLASPADVARVIVFLASDYSSYTTGQRVMVTGGAPPLL